MQINSIQLAELIYNESKFWIALAGGLWSVFKGIDWIKSIRTNDLHHIQLGVDNLGVKIDGQTRDIVNELKEMRQDIRAAMWSRDRERV